MGLLSDLLQQSQNSNSGNNPNELVPITDIVADLERRVSELEDTVNRVIDEMNGQTIQNAQNAQDIQIIQNSQTSPNQPPETPQQ
jgi:hypothetical protein